MDNEGNEKRTQLRRWKIKQKHDKENLRSCQKKNGPKT
jgi:hypothetical protein